MRNLKFLFLSLFLLFISASSTFAAITNIDYDINPKDGNMDSVDPTTIDGRSDFGFKMYNGSTVVLEWKYTMRDWITIIWPDISISQNKSNVYHSSTNNSATITNRDNTLVYYSDTIFNDKVKWWPIWVFKWDINYSNLIQNTYIELNNLITYLNNNSTPFNAIKSDVNSLRTKIWLINICNYFTGTDRDRTPDYNVCNKDKTESYLKVNVLIPDTYSGFTNLSLSNNFINIAYSGSTSNYTGACNTTYWVKTLSGSSEVKSCASKIAKKIIDASELGVKGYLSHNSTKLNEKLIWAYNVRVTNRKTIDSIIKNNTWILNMFTKFNKDKYDYLNGDISALNLGNYPIFIDNVITQKIANVIQGNMRIEIDEVNKAKEFKAKFDTLKTWFNGIDANVNAKLAILYELSKINFSNSIDRDTFYNYLNEKIYNITSQSNKVEQKLVLNVNSDSVISNKDNRWKALKKYINMVKGSDSTIADKIIWLRTEWTFFEKNTRWIRSPK